MKASVELAWLLDPGNVLRHSGMTPDAWQLDVLRSRAERTLLLCSRQAGKSTVAAALAIHQAVATEEALVLLLSPSLRQSQELLRKVHELARHISVADNAEETSLRLELPNGSRIISLPGSQDTIRGFSRVSLMVIDEAAFVDEEIYYAARPMLAVSRGRLIALSTPYGKRGWFHDAWADGGDHWHRILAPATACPRIDAAFLAEERRQLGEMRFRQEYMAEFVDADDQLFAEHLIRRALSDELEPLSIAPEWLT